MKNSISKFLQMVQDDCSRHGVEIIFHPKQEIKLSKKIGVSGFWTDEDKQLNVAIYCDEWLTVLAHEYGHFCQWKENKFVDDLKLTPSDWPAEALPILIKSCGDCENGPISDKSQSITKVWFPIGTPNIM